MFSKFVKVEPQPFCNRSFNFTDRQIYSATFSNILHTGGPFITKLCGNSNARTHFNSRKEMQTPCRRRSMLRRNYERWSTCTRKYISAFSHQSRTEDTNVARGTRLCVRWWRRLARIALQILLWCLQNLLSGRKKHRQTCSSPSHPHPNHVYKFKMPVTKILP
jgi:hypothetical protein